MVGQLNWEALTGIVGLLGGQVPSGAETVLGSVIHPLGLCISDNYTLTNHSGGKKKNQKRDCSSCDPIGEHYETTWTGPSR